MPVTSDPHPHSHHTHSHPQTNGQTNGNGHGHPDEFAILHMFLGAHFGDVSNPRKISSDGDEDELMTMDVAMDGTVARIDLLSMVSRPGKSVS